MAAERLPMRGIMNSNITVPVKARELVPEHIELNTPCPTCVSRFSEPAFLTSCPTTASPKATRNASMESAYQARVALGSGC